MLDGFCEYLRQQGKSENTVKSYCQGVKEYMRWHEETFGKRMKMLIRANVLDYISYLRTVKGLNNRSVNAKLASLHSFNLYLISAGYKTEVVLTKEDYLKVQTAYASPSTVDRGEVERFRQEILENNGIRDYAIVTILAYAGLRISECLELRMGDISLAAREITTRCGWSTSETRWQMRCGSISKAVRQRKTPIYSPDGGIATLPEARSTGSSMHTPLPSRLTLSGISSAPMLWRMGTASASWQTRRDIPMSIPLCSIPTPPGRR